MPDEEQQCHFWHKVDSPHSIFAQPENYVKNIENGIEFFEFKAALEVALSSVYGFDKKTFTITQATHDTSTDEDASLEAEIKFTADGIVMAKLRDFIK